MKIPLCIILLLASANAYNNLARFLSSSSSQDVTFSSDLECGSCIRGGYIYCVAGSDREIVNSNDTAPAGICCEGSGSCDEQYDDNYTCSNTYSDSTFALMLCPFKKSSCGNTSDFSFEKSGESESISMTLYPGDVCFYTVHADCGVPAFKPSTTTDVTITTIEYDDDEIEGGSVNENGFLMPGKLSLKFNEDGEGSEGDFYGYDQDDMYFNGTFGPGGFGPIRPPCDNSSGNCSEKMMPPCDNSTGNCSDWGWGWMMPACDNSTGNCSDWGWGWMKPPCDNSTGNCSDWNWGWMMSPCDNSTGNCSDWIWDDWGWGDWTWGDWMILPCDNSTGNCTYWDDWMIPPCDNSTGNCTYWEDWMILPCDNSTGNCTYWDDWMIPPCDNSTGNCSDIWAWNNWMTPCDNSSGNCSDQMPMDGGFGGQGGFGDFGGQGGFGDFGGQGDFGGFGDFGGSNNNTSSNFSMGGQIGQGGLSGNSSNSSGGMGMPFGGNNNSSNSSSSSDDDDNNSNSSSSSKKEGIKMETYDDSQGGIKKYKETDQDGSASATQDSSNETLCQGRNQMIIVSDDRTSSDNLRFLSSSSANIITMKIQTVGFSTTKTTSSSTHIYASISVVLGLVIALLM